MPFEVVPGGTPLFDAVPEVSIRKWIFEQKVLPLRTVPGIREERWADYHLSEIEALHAKADTVTLWSAEIPCLLMARRLTWDTAILGVPNMSLDHILFPNAADLEAVCGTLKAACARWCEEGNRFIVHKTSPSHLGILTVLGRAGFDMLCVHLDYLANAVKAASLATPLEGYEFGVARPEEEEAVATLTRNNYALMDRFNIDPLVPRDRVPWLYWEWGRNAFHGYSDVVWVARHEGKVVGISFWSYRKRVFEFTGVDCALNQLGAVDVSQWNKGLFRRITGTVLGHLREQGAEWGTISTNVLNHSLQRSVQALGCAIHEAVVTYRKDLTRR
jgi:hypothetical protein